MTTARPVLQRFMEKVEMVTESGCWIWMGCGIRAGYGQLVIQGRMQLAHRVSYELFVDKIPQGLSLDHLCRTPSCVNPRHLEPVTARENTRRGAGPASANAKKAACLRGHLFDDENTLLIRGNRHCRKCNSFRSARSKKSEGIPCQ